MDEDRKIEIIIEGWYDSLMEKPLKVLNIFNEFFGEDRVDMQGYLTLESYTDIICNKKLREYIGDRYVIDVPREFWEDFKDKTLSEIIDEYIHGKDTELGYVEKIKKYISIGYFNMFILVHFPHVRVSNEHNRFVDINHLWAKVKITLDGTIIERFLLNRSEYTVSHMLSNYLHSHIGSIPTHDFAYFVSPCTGTGPINNTMDSLTKEFDEDLWNLFCLELSKFVTIESLEGGPYHRLENIGIINSHNYDTRLLVYTSPSFVENPIIFELVKRFVPYFIGRKKLKFNYINNNYSLGMTKVEYLVLVSNEFISWYNSLFNNSHNKKALVTLEFLKNSRMLGECTINNGKIYYKGAANLEKIKSYVGKRVCTFKGEDITISITDIDNYLNNVKYVLLLGEPIASYILTVIFKVLNYNYGREESEENKSGTEVLYLS